MTEKRQTSQGYIIRILQHFATKLRNITNFVKLFDITNFVMISKRSIGGEGWRANIHIFAKSISKEVNNAEHEDMNIAPLPNYRAGGATVG